MKNKSDIPAGSPLEHSDRFHLQAAQGWFELGNMAEAEAELDKISPEHQQHPDLLQIRWNIQAKRKNWERCLELAETLLQLEPELPIGYVKKAVSFHGLERYEEAWDTLLPAYQKFPRIKAITYDLACYACRLKDLPTARKLLAEVFEGEETAMWKEMALKDPDLEPLWPEIT